MSHLKCLKDYGQLHIEFLLNAKVCNFFHFSLLKKYAHDPNHVIDWDVIQVEPEGESQTEPLCILDRKVIVLWNRAVGHVKVQCEHYGLEEATQELEDAMRLVHPFFFNFAGNGGWC